MDYIVALVEYLRDLAALYRAGVADLSSAARIEGRSVQLDQVPLKKAR
jgi:hypothetical protein